MSNNLEQPLGVAGKPVARKNLRVGKAVGIAAAALVVASAGFIALVPKVVTPPSKPQVIAAAPLPETAVEPALSAAEEALAAEAALEASAAAVTAAKIAQNGAKIIRVAPDAASPGIRISDPNDVSQALTIAHIPDPDLVEESAQGRLPKRATDGRRPLDVYARPWSRARGARIAIMIGGMGVSQTTTQNAMDTLPPEITLGFAPQGNSLARWAQTARRKGHEILLQVPMEPFDYPKVDPGRGTLVVSADAGTNIETLHQSMGRLTNYTGVVNYLGARFTADEAALDPLMADIGTRGLLYLDDGTSARSKADVSALKNRAAFAIADTVIDQTQDKNDILKALDGLEATARTKGTAIGVGTGFDVTIETVAQWVKEAQKRGIEIVGVSAMVTDPEK